MNGGDGVLRYPSKENLRSRMNHGSSSSAAAAAADALRGVRFSPDDPRGTSKNNDSWFDAALGILTAAVGMVCIAGLMTVLVVLFVAIRPFSKRTYRRLAAAWGASALVDAVTLLLPNVRIYLTGDSDVPSPVTSAVLVANHVLAADWWALFLLGRCVGLKGSLKVFLRNEFLHINMENVEASINSGNGTSGSGNGSSSSNSNGNGINGSSSNGNGTTGGGGVNGASANGMGRSNGGMHAKASNSSLATLPTSNGHAPSSPSSSTTLVQTHGVSARPCQAASPDLALAAKLLHLFLEFPLINGEDYTSDREQLFNLLRSFAHADTGSPVHLLFYPEGWSSIPNGSDRKSVHAKSNQFAKREGKAELKHLLMPRTRGFNASLECLRESNPMVYDVTMAYSGYDGSLPPNIDLSMTTLWNLLRRKFPKEVHLRIKRYSMEEVLQDSNWLFKKWAEKDRLLSHFARHQQFPSDNRGYGRHRVFDTRLYSMESSIVSLCRLLLLPCSVPFLLLLSVPLFWTMVFVWIGHWTVQYFHPVTVDDSQSGSTSAAGQPTPGSAGTAGTPFFPATPFATPSILNWRDMWSHQHNTNNGTSRH